MDGCDYMESVGEAISKVSLSCTQDRNIVQLLSGKRGNLHNRLVAQPRGISEERSG